MPYDYITDNPFYARHHPLAVQLHILDHICAYRNLPQTKKMIL